MPIKTTVSATVLEEALNGSVMVSQLQLGNSVQRKVCSQLSTMFFFPFFYFYIKCLIIACGQVEKQTAHLYSVDITEKQAKMGLVCRVHSNDKSKFKVYNQMLFPPFICCMEVHLMWSWCSCILCLPFLILVLYLYSCGINDLCLVKFLMF